jgi:hypothetical protein
LELTTPGSRHVKELKRDVLYKQDAEDARVLHMCDSKCPNSRADERACRCRCSR